MDLKVLVIILLLATLAASREYRLVNQQKTWEEAQSYCRENFADLATIETQAEVAQVEQITATSGSDFVWIGLYEDVESWRWSLDNTSFNNTVDSFLNHNFDGKRDQSCGILSEDTMHDHDCHDELPSLCYNESSNTYVPVNDRMTWESARSHCREHHADLAILRNQQELDAAQNQIDSTSFWWIGLSRESWKWSDQTKFSFSNWQTGQPNEKQNHCGGASVTGYNDIPCTWDRPFICSVPIRKVFKVAVKANGSVDLNDPLIQAAILSQVEKDMKAGGIEQDFKLSWRKQPAGNVFN